ncbi:hypothetical protein IMCGPPIG_01697 [Stenotrophomonas maltophilia]|jgi:hypothetical protein|nr:hypothetical protein [Stenotrophomonas maltophilia]MBA0483238.1 hypothetical protein [Stenotrophomonas maltophilia]MBA0491679.1 hypothetical protein [Stenotrophomonas maltophilia]MBA0492959.1 hypothetical protein [Stenotrophomonas maltophilia]QNG88812.1 hypothetical protein PLCFDHLH_04553 [Stenotrophomonas maltophilia]
MSDVEGYRYASSTNLKGCERYGYGSSIGVKGFKRYGYMLGAEATVPLRLLSCEQQIQLKMFSEARARI